VEDVVKLGGGHGGGGEREDASRTLNWRVYGPALLPQWLPSTPASKLTRGLSRSVPFANGLYALALVAGPILLLTANTGSIPSSRQTPTHP
jgi:hypothetical protein